MKARGGMTFNEFITSRRDRSDDPCGDFIADTQMLIRLGKFPAIASWRELEGFLWSRNACSSAIAVGRALWREYESEK